MQRCQGQGFIHFDAMLLKFMVRCVTFSKRVFGDDLRLGLDLYDDHILKCGVAIAALNYVKPTGGRPVISPESVEDAARHAARFLNVWHTVRNNVRDTLPI